ncbi:Potassium/sodium hyperpolarization-activated cyclic nucleotide-gated channel 4 [Melipona quadrifasciata]|uniref:Potassium/sodium hyperpolarization-activated cyclic nucleotide-gated channel 4 n=1 Tax=Melipona quadrifasciata TaxID=166423 RepID=A0A0M9A8V2_9HYME|nr:Potassium/sodium hyperpolarization-activated cyclic nucleotide-gated channel 4 [Melipona quadrifasciata]
MDLMAYVPHFSEAPNVEHAPVIQHVCEQQQEQDPIRNIIKGNRIWDKLNRWCLKQRILSKRHPLTRWCLKSTTAVNYEISRHLESYRYMIHPFSLFRIVWESLMIAFTFVALLITPVLITFFFDKHGNWHVINDIMNIVFFCDIVIWFFTGYYDYRTKVIVLDPMIVGRKYLQSYFFIDILTVLPIGIIDYIMPSSMWYCATLNMMKILRVRNIIVYFKTCTVVIMCIHWAACLQYYVPMSVNTLGTLSNDTVLSTNDDILHNYQAPPEDNTTVTGDRELILHNYLRLINSVELFKHLPDTVIVQLTNSLHSKIYMTGDEIVKAGTRGEALYFISSGTVAVYTMMGKEVCHLEDGSYFGEIALVMDTEHRIATVVAVETCEICVLHRHDFQRFISPYPDLLNHLQNIALEHLNKSLLLDSAQFLETSITPQYINISSIKSKKM